MSKTRFLILNSNRQNRVSYFFHSSPVDLLYAEEVHFCSFVTKSNQECTNIHPHPNVFNSFHMTLLHGESHGTFTTTPPPPLNGIFPTFHRTTSFVCCLRIFCIRVLQKTRQKINNISKSSEKPPHTLFFRFKENSLFWRRTHFFPILEFLPPKVHAVSIGRDDPL